MKNRKLVGLLLLLSVLPAFVFALPENQGQIIRLADENIAVSGTDSNANQSPALLAIQAKLDELQSSIQKMRKNGLSTQRVSDGWLLAKELVQQAQESTGSGTPNFSAANRKISETMEIVQLSFRALDEVTALENRLGEVRSEIDPSTVEEILQQAKTELKNERYEQAIELADQGQKEIILEQSFSTKAQAKAEALAAGMARFLDQHKTQIGAGIIILTVLLLLLQSRITHYMIRSRIKRLELERNTIKKEVTRAQEQFFRGKMPENLYHVRTSVFNEKLREITRKLAILMEAEKKTGIAAKEPESARLKKKETEQLSGMANEKKNQGDPVASALKEGYFKTGIKGLDSFLKHGIPIGSSILIEGGPGSGKTMFCLQVAVHACNAGKKVLYMSFEEREDHLATHMKNIGGTPEDYQKKGLLMIKRFNALDIARSVEALLSEAKKELLINIQPVLIPTEFEPDMVLIDSLTSISSAFSGEEYRFRIYMEQLFRHLESHNITSMLIRETATPSHVGGERLTETEEAVSFLSDGIIALYTVLYHEGSRRRAIEIIKLRGEEFERKLVEFKIQNNLGIFVYPDHPIIGQYHLT
jgi:KaiC/GvpD/RAD55 family RecA-like ATPase